MFLSDCFSRLLSFQCVNGCLICRIAQKFSASVANTGKQSSPLSATPEWTFQCGGQGSTNCSGVAGAFNTMRVFTENGVEKIASTFRLPKSAIITLNASNGTEDRFAKTNNKG